MEWVFALIIVIGILAYEIVDRYFEYKEKVERSKEWTEINMEK